MATSASISGLFVKYWGSPNIFPNAEYVGDLWVEMRYSSSEGCGNVPGLYRWLLHHERAMAKRPGNPYRRQLPLPVGKFWRLRDHKIN